MKRFKLLSLEQSDMGVTEYKDMFNNLLVFFIMGVASEEANASMFKNYLNVRHKVMVKLQRHEILKILLI